MIYTVAEKAPTDAALASGQPFMMRGQGFVKGFPGLYPGGAVFETREAAQAFLDAKSDELKDWAVFGCEADWDKHCVERAGEAHRRLVVDRPMVKL